jgi:NAD+ kinase
MTLRIRRVGVLGHADRPDVRRVAAGLRASLSRRGIETRFDARLGADFDPPGMNLRSLARWCQILVTLGGDGTVLAGGRALVGTNAVLLPINLGGLGFLTIADQREMASALSNALGGKWPIARRRMVSAMVRRRGRTVKRGVAMNDAVIKGAGGYAAVHLRIATWGTDLGHLVADGLIAATAAGSTAYSLSAGGPLMAPDVEAMVVTPVCAHALGSRSLVLPAGAELDVRVIGSFDRPVLLFDGQEMVDLSPADQIRIRLDRPTLRVFENPDRPFAEQLRRKLRWQGSAKRSM